MTPILVGVAVMAVVALLRGARTARRSSVTGLVEPVWLRAPQATHLPHGNASYPRVIDRCRAGGSRRANAGMRRLAGVVAALILLLLAASLVENKHDGRVAPTRAAAPHPSALGASMPKAAAGNTAVRPMRLVIVFDDAYGASERAAELTRLGGWLRANHDPRTRVVVVDGPARTVSARLTPARLQRDVRVVPARSISRVVERRLDGRRAKLLVAVGDSSVRTNAKTPTLVARTRSNASVARTVALRKGDRHVVEVDPRRRGALAATIARAAISLSGMREVR